MAHPPKTFQNNIKSTTRSLKISDKSNQKIPDGREQPNCFLELGDWGGINCDLECLGVDKKETSGFTLSGKKMMLRGRCLTCVHGVLQLASCDEGDITQKFNHREYLGLEDGGAIIWDGKTSLLCGGLPLRLAWGNLNGWRTNWKCGTRKVNVLTQETPLTENFNKIGKAVKDLFNNLSKLNNPIGVMEFLGYIRGIISDSSHLIGQFSSCLSSSTNDGVFTKIGLLFGVENDLFKIIDGLFSCFADLNLDGGVVKTIIKKTSSEIDKVSKVSFLELGSTTEFERLMELTIVVDSLMILREIKDCLYAIFNMVPVFPVLEVVNNAASIGWNMDKVHTLIYTFVNLPIRLITIPMKISLASLKGINWSKTIKEDGSLSEVCVLAHERIISLEERVELLLWKV